MSSQIEERNKRTKWFKEARFGLFLHWGLYSISAIHEHLRARKELTIEEYQKYFDEFDPKDFNPKEWARIAKEAGMKYAVLTAKHHDGFCLFDSKYTNYKSTNTKFGRDIIKEYVEAFRNEGLKVGLYYSLIDWYHPDYPHFNDKHHPMRNNIEYKDKKQNFSNYLEYMHGQIKELLTNYGKIDLMWFDFSYDDMRCEKWEADKIMDMVKKYQPDMIIDNRLEGSSNTRGSIMTKNPSVYSGDFASPELMIPPQGLINELGDPIPWESSITLNKHWTYNSYDNHYKSAKLVIRSLVECVSKNGNLIVNVGPNARGNFPTQAKKILKEIGEWMKLNGESIYGCGQSKFKKPDWGRLTQKGNKLYAHVLEESVSAFALEDIKSKIKNIRRLDDYSEINLTDFWTLKAYSDYAYFFLDSESTDGYPLPNEIDTVLEITLIEE